MVGANTSHRKRSSAPPRLLVQTGGKKSCYREHTGACRPCHGDTCSWTRVAWQSNSQPSGCCPDTGQPPCLSQQRTDISAKQNMDDQYSFDCAVPPCNAGLYFKRMRKTKRAPRVYPLSTHSLPFIYFTNKWQDGKAQSASLHKIIQLFKAFKNQVLLFRWNATSGIVMEKSAVPASAIFSLGTMEDLFRKLGGIHQQVYQDLAGGAHRPYPASGRTNPCQNAFQPPACARPSRIPRPHYTTSRHHACGMLKVILSFSKSEKSRMSFDSFSN